MFQPRYPGPVETDPAEGAPHAGVLVELSEIGRERAGSLLRRTLRATRAWMEGGAGEAPGEEERPEKVVPELGTTLSALFRILREEQPDDEVFEAVALAALHVATWAEKAGAYRTALAFFQLAEDADPDNPHHAYGIGRMARKVARYGAAEAWLKWAHWTARGRRNWEVAALSLSGLGNLHRQRGNLPLATRFHELTRRVARLHNLRTLEGDALYDLAGIAFDFGDTQRGIELARGALEAYGPGHRRVYSLARDIAWVWMDRFGLFENAAQMLLLLLEHLWEPFDRVLLLANLARAAAGAGWNDLFENMWNETWATMREQSVRSGHAGALIQLAYGAGMLGYWDRSHLAASEALTVAREREESEMIMAAESILDAVQHGVIGEETIRRVFRDRRDAPAARRQRAWTDLAADLTNAMQVRRDDAPLGPARTLVHG